MPGKPLNSKVHLDIHLDPSYEAFMLFEAPNVEAGRDLLVRVWFTHFLDVEFHLVTHVNEILEHVDQMPMRF